MDYGHTQHNLHNGKSLPAGGGQADYSSEDCLPDNGLSFYRYLDVWLDKLPWYSCDHVLQRCIRMLDSEWHWKDPQPQWWPSGIRYTALKNLRKPGILAACVDK